MSLQFRNNIQASSTGAIIDAQTGFRVNGGATSGNFLRGNGTNFVPAAITAADVPSLDASKITTGTFDLARLGSTGSGTSTVQTTTGTQTTIRTITPTTESVITIFWKVVGISTDGTTGGAKTIISTYHKDVGGTLTKWGETFAAEHYGTAQYLADSAVSGGNIILRVQNNSGDGKNVNWKVAVTSVDVEG